MSFGSEFFPVCAAHALLLGLAAAQTGHNRLKDRDIQGPSLRTKGVTQSAATPRVLREQLARPLTSYGHGGYPAWKGLKSRRDGGFHVRGRFPARGGSGEDDPDDDIVADGAGSNGSSKDSDGKQLP